MTLPDPLMDETFVFAPSMLVEGKAIGTAKHADLILTKNLLSKSNVDPKDHAKILKIGVTVGRKKLAEVQERVRKKVGASIVSFQSGDLDADGLREVTTATMKEAWRDAFLSGIRAAGVPGTETGHGKLVVPDVLPAADEVWLKSAMQHEMGFLNDFLDDIVNENLRMPVLRRLQMYVDALGSFYESARVIGLPQEVLLWWAGPHDKNSCAGCKFLWENGPYTKLTLPTTPRAGLTPCLTNCRDRILVRRAPLEEVAKAGKSAKYTRAGFIAALRRIKRTGKL